MELFDKIYSCYFNTVSHILSEASEHPITRQQMDDIIQRYGYAESSLTILPKLLEGDWALLEPCTVREYEAVCSPVRLPLTELQKSWLKALLNDERIRLFLSEDELREAEHQLMNVEPLYQEQHFHYFDRARDSDPYSSPRYQLNFHTILDALRQNRALYVAYQGKNQDTSTILAAPYQLQFSPRDDKFRLCCLKNVHGHFCQPLVLNVGRITACQLSHESIPETASDFHFQPVHRCEEPVLLEISKERNSLERCMLHFASYEKHTEYIEERGVYLCSIYYDTADETELLIQILSFGPVVRILGPEPFLEQAKRRIQRQYELLHPFPLKGNS